MTHLELCARLTVRPGQLEGFKAQVAEIVRAAQEEDTRSTASADRLAPPRDGPQAGPT